MCAHVGGPGLCLRGVRGGCVGGAWGVCGDTGRPARPGKGSPLTDQLYVSLYRFVTGDWG